jgi:hypothetical protein
VGFLLRLTDPERRDLRDLFFDGHAVQQVGHPLLDRQILIAVIRLFLRAAAPDSYSVLGFSQSQITLWNCSNFSRNDKPARDHICRFGVGASREAGLFASDTDRKLARLDDALAIVVNDRHPLGVDRE